MSIFGFTIRESGNVRIQSMGDDKASVHNRISTSEESKRGKKDRHGATSEFPSNDRLNLTIRLGIDSSGRFVENKNLAVSQQRSAETHELTLTGRQIRSSLVDMRVERSLHRLHVFLESTLLQHSPKVGVGSHSRRIDVLSKSSCVVPSATEHQRKRANVPSKHCESCGMILSADRSLFKPSVETSTPSMMIFPDSGSTTRYSTCSTTSQPASRDDREERATHHRQTRLPRPSSPANSNLLPSLQLEAHIAQHEVEIGAISCRDSLIGESTLARPICGRLRCWNFGRGFGFQFDVLLNSLDGDDVGLDLGGRSNDPIQSLIIDFRQPSGQREGKGATNLRGRKRIRQHETNETSVDIPCANEREDSESSGGENDD